MGEDLAGEDRNSVEMVSWPEEYLRRFYLAAINRISDQSRTRLFRAFSSSAEMKRALQRENLPTIPPRMKAGLRQPNGWLLARFAGKVLDQSVAHVDTSEDMRRPTLEALHEHASSIEEQHGEGCGRLWLVWLLETPKNPADQLLVEVLLRDSDRFGLDAMKGEGSPNPLLGSDWTGDATALGPEHPCWLLTGSMIQQTLDGERDDPDLMRWLKRVPEEPPTPLEQLTEAHHAATEAAQRLSTDLAEGGFGRSEDHDDLAKLNAVISELELTHGSLGADLTEAASVLTPEDPSAVLLERLAQASSHALGAEQLAPLHAAARSADEPGELRDALVAFAMMAEESQPPDVAEITELISRLPFDLHPAAIALAQASIRLPSVEAPDADPRRSDEQPPTHDDPGIPVEPEPTIASTETDAPQADEASREALDTRSGQAGHEASPEALDADGHASPDEALSTEEAADTLITEPAIGADDQQSNPTPTLSTLEVQDSAAGATVSPTVVLEPQDLTPQPAGDGKDSDVGDTVGELLEAGAYGAAVWVARAGGWSPASVDVLEAAAYAKVMRSATSTSANRYGVLANRFRVSDINQHRSLQLLALAAAARSVLVASYVGGLQVLESIRATVDNPASNRIIDALTSVGGAGIELSNQLLAGVRDRADLERSIDAAQDKAASLSDELPQRKAPFHRATRVWQHWLEADAPLGGLLHAVAVNDRSSLPDVQTTIIQLRDDRRLSDLIDETDTALTDVQTVRRNPIEAIARTWLHRTAQQVLGVAEEWHAAAQELTQHEIDQGPRAEHHLERLRRVVTADHDAMLEWVLDAPAGRSRFALGARTAAGDLLKTSFDLLLHGSPLRATDPPVDAVRTMPLLGATSLRLSNGEPIDPSCVDADAVCAAMQTDLVTAFTEREEQGDHETSAMILDVLAWQQPPPDPAELASLRQARERALTADLAALERLHETCSLQLRQSRRLGHINELEASQLQVELERLTPETELTNTALVRAELDRFQEVLDGHRRAAGDLVSRQLDELIERLPGQVSQDDAQRIRDLIDVGNLDTATELLSLLSAGRPLPVGEPHEKHLSRFFPELTDVFAASPPALRSLLDAIDNRGSLASLDFSTLSVEAATRAKQAVRTWYQLNDDSPSENRPRLLEVLALLGLQVTDSGITHSPGLRSDAHQQWFDLDDARPFSKATVHQFGSSARGRYRVMLTSSEPSVPRLLEYASAHSGTQPLLVLHLGVLDANARRELAQELRRSPTRRNLIVVDDVVVAYLASEGSGRFSTLLSCCLPFAGISPYTPYGLGNVPPEMFFGRESELQSIQDRFGTLFIYGGRQLGKSALLRAAERDFKARSPHHVAGYVDLKARGIGVYRPADEVIDVILELIGDAGLNLEMPRNRAQWPEALVSQLQQWVSDHPERAMLLLLDEADDFLDVDAPAFRNVTLLKRLFETTGRAVKPVFAGLHQVQRFMSVPNQPLAHLGRHIEIGPLSPQAAFDLVTAPTDALGYEFASDDTAARVLSHTNYQPGIIQLFADKLVQFLMRRPVQLGSPPYPISDDDVAAVHQNPDLLQEIRKRFDLTMALDPRYRIIAYSLAYSTSGSHLDEGLTSESLLRESLDWWPAGFEDQTVGSFATLLDEMVGLGVLRRTRRDGYHVYAMRSPNTLRLLGSTEDIENELLEASTLELAKPLDINVFHRTIGPDDNRRSSPLDEQQLSRLIAPQNRFLAVLGSEAAGIDDLPQVIRDATRGEGPTVYVRTAPHGEFRSRLTPMFADAEDPEAHRILIADLAPDRKGSLLDRLDQMRDSVEEYAKSSTTRATLTVIARVRSSALECWSEVLNHHDASVTGSVVELARWSDHALRLWAQHLELPLDDAGVAPLRAATGGWVTLIDEVQREWRRGVRWDDALAKVRERLNDRSAAKGFLEQLGLQQPSYLSGVVGELVSFGSGLQPDDVLKHLRDSPAGNATISAKATLDVLRALQVIELRTDDTSPLLYLDPITERAWELAHG